MPQGGVEPPVARFLRPPRLPFRHCGDVLRRSASADRLFSHVSALRRIRTCTLFRERAPQARAYAKFRRQSSTQRRGKGSNLHPPASETGAESASASATHFSKCPEQDSNLHPKGGA